MERFAALEQDWDSYGGVAPSPKAIAGARDLIATVAAPFSSVEREQALPWTVVPLADGGVLIEWRGPRATIEVDIDGDGRLGYLLDNPAASERFEEAEGLTVEAVRRRIGDIVGGGSHG